MFTRHHRLFQVYWWQNRQMATKWEPEDDEDLSDVVTRLSAVRASTRRKQANDPQTRAILAASMRLIDRQFAPDSGHDTDQDEAARRYPFFQWLSRPKIAAEVAAAHPDMAEYERDEVRAATARQMEHRWRSHDHFLQDLLNYALRKRHWSLHLATRTDLRDNLLGALLEGDLVAAIHEVAYEDLEIPTRQPGAQRMQLIAAALAEREPDLRKIMTNINSVVDANWTETYQAVIEARGLTLRPGITPDDLNLMLSTAAEGMALRMLISEEGLVDDVARTSMLGKVTLAVLYACIDPGDGRTLEEAVTSVTGPAS